MERLSWPSCSQNCAKTQTASGSTKGKASSALVAHLISTESDNAECERRSVRLERRLAAGVLLFLLFLATLRLALYGQSFAGSEDVYEGAALCQSCQDRECAASGQDSLVFRSRTAVPGHWLFSGAPLQCTAGLCVPDFVADPADLCGRIAEVEKQDVASNAIVSSPGRRLLVVEPRAKSHFRVKSKRRRQPNRDKHQEYFINRELREFGSERQKPKDGSSTGSEMYLRVHAQVNEEDQA